jgi:hypothetical protein
MQFFLAGSVPTRDVSYQDADYTEENRCATVSSTWMLEMPLLADWDCND